MKVILIESVCLFIFFSYLKAKRNVETEMIWIVCLLLLLNTPPPPPRFHPVFSELSKFL